MAFRDIQPAAPAHVLLIPKEHVTSISALTDDDQMLAGALLIASQRVARREGIESNGYRIVSNTGAWGGQTVDHLHLHVLGGRQLGALG